MIDGQNVCDEPARQDLITYDNIKKNCNKSRR